MPYGAVQCESTAYKIMITRSPLRFKEDLFRIIKLNSSSVQRIRPGELY